MTPLPKRRHSTKRGGKREAAISKNIKVLEKCPKCSSLKLPHRACSECGYYKNLQIFTPLVKKDKK